MSSFQEIIGRKPLVLVDFYADWCGPCKTLAPILKQVKDALQDGVAIIKINVDSNQRLAEQYQVRGVPTLILFKHGAQVWRQSGLMMQDDLITIINRFS